MTRLFLAVLAFLAVSAAAAPAHALLPEPYVGLGTRTFGLPSGNAGWALSLEGGADAIFSDMGAGIRVDFPFDSFGNPLIAAQFRYSILKVPFIRILAAAEGGVIKGSKSMDGTFGAWLGARASLGLPYLNLNLGYSYAGKAELFSVITIGMSF
ncbi:MAG: hypothetical protein EXR79_14805 [Myxococcales bacterium]|nr:hypothetical protein [Myxococcales bacterium]